MDILDRDEIRDIIDKRSDFCVSIYLPTHRAGKDVEQNSIRFKNLLRRVEKELGDWGLRAQQIQEVLEPAEKLLAEELFWSYQSDGLAIFLSGDEFRHYRLPIQFEELAIISHRYHIKPLLPFLTMDGRFYILAVSQNLVRLLEGTAYSVNQVILEDIPQSLSEALKYDDLEKQPQFHTRAQPVVGGRRAAMFHGHGVSKDSAADKKNILRYFQMLDNGLRDVFAGEHVPLVLAGVEFLRAIYKEANSYPHLLDPGIQGNPDELSPNELHEKAWQIVQPAFQKAQMEAFDKYKRLAGTGQTSRTVEEIVQQAFNGRVESLFVTLDARVWGRFDRDNHDVEIHETPTPKNEDLLDFAAVHTYLNRGRVYVVTSNAMPDEPPVAAVLRF